MAVVEAKRPSTFPSIYSDEEVIIILEELKNFLENNPNIKNKWVEFRKVCTVDEKFSAMQIRKKVITLEEKFQKDKIEPSSPFFDLCKSLWGEKLDQPQKPEPEKRSLIIPTNVGLPSKNELELYLQILTLQQTHYRNLLQQMEHEIQSSPPKKRRRAEKNIPQQLSDHPGDEKEDNLDEIEAQVDGNNKDMSMVEYVELETHEAMDLDVNGMDVVPLQSVVKVDDGEKKKKKKKKKAKKVKANEEEQKETSPQAIAQQLAIEELEHGDPNGKKVSKGANKVKIRYTAKVKGSEKPFESTIGRGPQIINFDDEEIIEGLRIGTEGMHVGGRRRILIPPSLGYGDDGCESAEPPIPPNSWLEYEVQLLNVANVHPSP